MRSWLIILTIVSMGLLSLSVLAFTGLPYFPLKVAFQQNGYAPATVTAEATGSETPQLTENAALEDTVTNGDFTITRVPEGIDTTLGNGLDEATTWTFDFSGDPNFDNFPSAPLAFARLELTLIPQSTLVSFDLVSIEGLNDISSPPQFQSLPVGEPTNVQIDLLDFYTSDEIIQILSAGGEIPMYYADDSTVSFARLSLTSDIQP